MTARRDDDALSWDGDDDPTLDVGGDAPRTPPFAPAPDAASPPSRGREPRVGPGRERDTPVAVEAPAGLGNLALVGLGLLAGASLLFAVGWFLAGLRLQALGVLPVSPVMLAIATFATAAAPLVWFATAFALTRRSRTWVRVSWLIAGVALLVPWPFLFLGGVR